jgi:hypothetical protein
MRLSAYLLQRDLPDELVYLTSSHRGFRSGEDELFGKAETDFIVEDMSEQDFEAC